MANTIDMEIKIQFKVTFCSIDYWAVQKQDPEW